jgi:ubiquitin carboxyl-terminal hydrolase 6/32
VNNKWVKSQKVVNFPYEDFDPTPYLASVPQETILRHRDLLSIREDARNHDCNEEITEFDREISKISENSDEEGAMNGDVDVSSCASTPHKDKEREKKAPVIANCIPNKTRQRLVSTSLTKTPVIDGEFTDFHDHKLKQEQDPFDLNYQLYAVVVSIYYVGDIQIKF